MGAGRTMESLNDPLTPPCAATFPPGGMRVSGNSPYGTLYYGDNLHILRKYVRDETIDLVYIDPPFNSNANFNLLFKEQDGTRAASQIKAFEDTWQWNVESDRAYRELQKRADPVAQAMYAFYRMLGTSDMLAYLAMMAVRLVELHRVLKPTGSFYLHCDPTASHYLKVLLDALFGPRNFRSEITWLRSRNPKGSQHKHYRYSPDTDIILFYAKTEKVQLHYDRIKRPLTADELLEKYDRIDEHGRWMDGPILRSESMGDRANLVYEYNGFTPGPYGWRVEKDKLQALDARGNIYWPEGKKPRRKLRPEEDTGAPVGNCWTDISSLNSQSLERIGYPTQKPLTLLERIIKASSNEGDVILDAFCGCGTAVVAAQQLGRDWIGIDVARKAIDAIRARLDKQFGVGTAPVPIGQPQSVADATAMAKDSPYAFEDWALSLVSADQPAKKRGADQGIDGRRVIGVAADGKPLEMLVSVKSGRVSSPHVRDLRGTVEREKAAMGIFITLQSSTKAMRDEAMVAGPCEIPGFADDCPRLQILTIAELLDGKQPQFPAPLSAASPTPKPRPTQLAPVKPFQRPLPGAAIVDVSKRGTARPERLRAVPRPRRQSAGD